MHNIAKILQLLGGFPPRPPQRGAPLTPGTQVVTPPLSFNCSAPAGCRPMLTTLLAKHRQASSREATGEGEDTLIIVVFIRNNN